jgi:crotonyl-CoA carboxylase/reductase
LFCAGTSGFNITFDARYVWMRQKRIQGSHFAHLKQASAANQFVLDHRIYPGMSEVLAWEQIPHAHHLWKNAILWRKRHKHSELHAPKSGHKPEGLVRYEGEPGQNQHGDCDKPCCSV